MTNDNKEKYPVTDDVHVFVAIQRSKENDATESQRRVHRRVIRDYNDDLEFLRAVCKLQGGTWRIYRTVNKRSFKKANKLFRHMLIDNYDEYYYRIDSLWKTCLMKPSSRAEKKFMLDIHDLNLQSLTLNFKDLMFLNSSGINMLCKFVLDVKKIDKMLIKVIGNKNILWQTKSFKNLKLLWNKLKLDFV